MMRKLKTIGIIIFAIAFLFGAFRVAQYLGTRDHISQMSDLLQANRIWYWGVREVDGVFDKYIGNRIVVTDNLADSAIISGDVIVIGEELIAEAANDHDIKTELQKLLNEDVKIVLKPGKTDPQELLLSLTGQTIDRKADDENDYAPYFSITKSEGELLITGYTFTVFETGTAREAFVLLDTLRQ